MRRSKIHDQQSRIGARFGAYHDWEIASDFGDPEREYACVREAVGALDVSYVGKIHATGRDRAKYLHNMLSNDVKSLAPGKGCYATLLTHQGHMEADLYVYASSEEIVLETPPSADARVMSTLSKYIIADQVALENRTDETGILSLQGPSSKRFVCEILGRELVELAPLDHVSIARPSGTWVVTRRDRTGCDGYDLWMTAGDLESLWAEWVESTKIPAVGHQALNWLRTEAGIPWYGIEMDEKTLPMEMGLLHALSMTKGCYRGQEIVARVLHRGNLNRGLGAVAIDGDLLPERGEEVRAGGSKVGEVRSAIHSPALGKPLALALLKKEALAPGTSLEVLIGTTPFPARVVRLPLDKNGD